MKGIINRSFQEMVEKKFGLEVWGKIKAISGCEEPFFAFKLDFPDEMTIALVNASSEISGLPVDTMMIEFGKFAVTNTFKEYYHPYFNLAGSSPREFLLNIDTIHDKITKNIDNAKPPKFEFEELPDGRVLMHYYSKLGLCKVLQGLILGVGSLFNQNLEVNEIACSNKGDSHCIMEVHFP